jgi:hypothetical protein
VSGRNRGRRLGSHFSGEACAPTADLPAFPDLRGKGVRRGRAGRSRNSPLAVCRISSRAEKCGIDWRGRLPDMLS